VRCTESSGSGRSSGLGLPVTLEPEDAYWARIFYGLDPDGYELMFEQHHAIDARTRGTVSFPAG
jgi:hypothetical protein